MLVSRHPYEWLTSMRRNAFYANFHKGLPMLAFLTLQWMSVVLSPAGQSRCSHSQSSASAAADASALTLPRNMVHI